MKRLFILFIFTSTLSAQSLRTTFTYFAGPSVPTQPRAFRQTWNTGLDVGLGVGTFLTREFELRFVLSYDYFSLNGDQYLAETGAGAAGYSVSGGANTILAVTAGGEYLLTPAILGISPYVLGNIGLMSFGHGEITLRAASASFFTDFPSETAILMQAGAGLNVAPSSIFSIYLESFYTMCFTKGVTTGFLPVRIGILISY